MQRCEIKHRNLYQIRHTYVFSMLTADATSRYLTEQLGHEDVKMVIRTYGKFIREDYQKPKAQWRMGAG